MSAGLAGTLATAAAAAQPHSLANGDLDRHGHAAPATAFALGPAGTAAGTAAHVTIRPLGAEARLQTRPATTGAWAPVGGLQALLQVDRQVQTDVQDWTPHKITLQGLRMQDHVSSNKGCCCCPHTPAARPAQPASHRGSNAAPVQLLVVG